MPPCNCHHTFPRPEPFSPLPRPGKVPDWGKWIRDRLAEKGALLVFPGASAFPDPGVGPNLYLAEDTDIVYRWNGAHYQVVFDPEQANDVLEYEDRGHFPDVGRTGVIYIDASENLIYRWNGAGYVLLTSDLSGVESRLAGVESKIPTQATAQNQLADKSFVNSSIATNTAFYISDNGRPFQSLADLENYEGALTNNDYAFVVGRDAAGNTTYTRYKWNEATETWGEEYVLNNSSFTAAQWAAISSGITSGLVAKLGALPTAEALAAALANKQDKLTFETTVIRGSDNPVKSSGIWAAIWGALTALPGVSSLYDWCVSQLAGKQDALTAQQLASIAAVPDKANTIDLLMKLDSTSVAAAWSSSNTYLSGDICTHNGVLYRCVVSVTSPSTTSPDEDFQHWSMDDINTLLRGKLDKSGGTLTGPLTVQEAAGIKFGGTVFMTAAVDRLMNRFLILHPGADPTVNSLTIPVKGGTTALAAANPTAGNLAALDAQGNPTDSGLSKDEVESLLFAKYYPDGSVKSAAELTSGIKYDFDDNDRTASALPFCDTGTGEDNHNLTGRVVIPSFVDRQGNPYLFDDGTKYKVVEVMDDRMDGYGNSGLTDIIAPTTVTRVGVNSFCGCEDLVSASFPGMTTVDLYAFYECSSLESIALPLAATIGDESFVGCSALASVAFPSATSIGDGVFTACSSLASATLPAVTSIGEQSFADCSALAYVVVSSVRSIGRNAFARCSSLASVEIPSATTVDYAAFTGCRALTAVSAPTATSVGEQAFKDCSALASIELPSVTGIGDNAFWACSSLKSAVLPSATTIGAAAFANCEALASIDIPSATAIGGSAFYHCLALDVLDFGAVQSVPTLGVGAFQDVPTTCKIIVPDAQYDAWVAASGWSDLVTAGYKFLRRSEWEHARKYDLRYDLVTKTIDEFGIVILDDHAINAVEVYSALATLTIACPAATNGKVRDFGLRLTISAGVTAPELSLNAGEVAEFETSDGEIPVIADGGTDGSTNILYFTETAANTFLVKAETVKAISQQ